MSLMLKTKSDCRDCDVSRFDIDLSAPRRVEPPTRRPTAFEWLPPRERQIACIVSGQGEASANDVCAALGGCISNAAVRSMLRRLEFKGVLQRRKDGRKFLYILALSTPEAGLQALKALVDSHFNGSPMEAALSLLGMVPVRDRVQSEAVLRLSALLKEVELD